MFEEKSAANFRRAKGQNRSEISLEQNEITNKLGQGQSDTTNKLGQGQSETTNKVTENEKLVEDEEFFPVFEEQEERLLRLEINCENLLQNQVHE